MPFTFAHPLYAAPLKRIMPAWLSLTGLILGSMSPDFEYFIALEPYQSIGHTAKGLWLQAVPLSVLFAFLFHKLIKPQLARHLPAALELDRRACGLVREWRVRGARDWLVFLVSVIVGFYSHLLLDAFTHRTGVFVVKLPLLSEAVLGTPFYKLLQHSLSLIGLAAEAIFVIRLLRRHKPSSAPFVHASGTAKRRFWTIAALAAVLTVLLKLLLADSANLTGILVVSPITGFLLGITGASLFARYLPVNDR